jgi:hypothetical protein
MKKNEFHKQKEKDYGHYQLSKKSKEYEDLDQEN